MVETHNAMANEQCGVTPTDPQPDSIFGDDEHSFVVISEPHSTTEMGSLATNLNFQGTALESTMQSLNLNGTDQPRNSFEAGGSRMFLPGHVSPLHGLDSIASSLSSLGPEEKDLALKSLLQQNLHLKETVHQNNLRLKQQVQVLSSLSQSVQVFKIHKERFKETQNFVSKLQSENAKLQQQLHEKQSSCEHEPSTSTALLNELQAELEAVKSRCETEKEEKSNMFEQLHALQAENKALSEQIATLKTNKSLAVDLEKAQSDGYIQQIYELTAKLVDSEDRNSRQKTEVERLHEEMNALSMKFRGRIDNMTATIVEQQDTIASRTRKLEDLQAEVLRLTQENEAIYFYKAQLEAYQSDFMIERGERERIAGELFQLQHDFRLLHQRNQDLEKSLLESSANGDNAGSADAAAAVLESSNPPVRHFYCPKCSMAFQKIDPLRLHVESCLELH